LHPPNIKTFVAETKLPKTTNCGPKLSFLTLKLVNGDQMLALYQLTTVSIWKFYSLLIIIWFPTLGHN